MRKSYHILYLLLACSLIACSPRREVRTAQAVVRTADSLWQEGKMYDDSLSLAQAYETLGRISRYILPITNHQLQITNTYAHSCYHYGRLTYEDHRMALAFAPYALTTEGLIINNPQVVTKSYPHFWDDLKNVGFKIEETDK